MHHLFVDASEELKRGGEVKVLEPFVESIFSGEESKECCVDGPMSERTCLSEFNLRQMKVSSYLFRDASLMFNRQVEATLRLPVVYIFALPVSFDHIAFLEDCLKDKWHQVKHLRVFLEEKKKSIVVYFKEREDAEIFTHQYNCSPINEKNEEFMLIISLSSVTFIHQKSLLATAIEELHNIVVLYQLPNCPVCIERLETLISGFTFSSAMNLHIYEHTDRWALTKNACATCSLPQLQECQQCGEREGLWVCLVCGNMGCGRYKKGHAREHWYSSGHCLSMDVESERIWDYFNDTFVHRLMRGENERTMIVQATNNERIPCHRVNGEESRREGNSHMMVMWDFWEETSNPSQMTNEFEGQLKQEDKISGERVDNAIWEYCYVISHQMEEQRKYFEKKIEEVERLQQTIRDNNEKEILLLVEELAVIKSKKEDIKKARDTCSKKTKTIADKNVDMERAIDESKMFITGIEQNVTHLQEMAKTQSINEIHSQSPQQLLIQQETTKLNLLEQQLSSLYLKLSQ